MNEPEDGRAWGAAAVWLCSASLLAIALAASVFLALGIGDRGTHIALQATARLAFVLFFPVYVGGALIALFGARAAGPKRHARGLGLAFAGALLVHLGVVGWLCYIGSVPDLRTFLIFGAAALTTYGLALLSIVPLGGVVGSLVSKALITFGPHYIAYAFAIDFLRIPPSASAKYLLGYLPFAALSVLGPLLRLAALGKRLTSASGPRA